LATTVVKKRQLTGVLTADYADFFGRSGLVGNGQSAYRFPYFNGLVLSAIAAILRRKIRSVNFRLHTVSARCSAHTSLRSPTPW
jgi:hypothetical protein